MLHHPVTPGHNPLILSRSRSFRRCSRSPIPFVEQTANPKAGYLGFVASCQGSAEDGDGDDRFAGCAVDLAFGVVSGHGALDDAGTGAQPPAGHQAGQDEPADMPGQVGGGAGDDAGGEDALVAGGVQGDGEAAAIGVGAGNGASGVGDGGAQYLVGDEQGVDLLVDAAGGAGAQDPAAEDGGLELEVGALDFPALVVQDGQIAGGVAVRVRQGGDQPAAACRVPGTGRDGDLGVEDPDGDAAEARQPRPVRKAAQDREPRGAVAGADPDQEVCPGSRDLRGQEPGPEAAVGQQDHPRVQAAQQA